MEKRSGGLLGSIVRRLRGERVSCEGITQWRKEEEAYSKALFDGSEEGWIFSKALFDGEAKGRPSRRHCVMG
jgi:hypothetical protein